MSSYADLPEAEREYVQKRLNETRSRWAEAEKRAQDAADALLTSCNMLEKLNFGPFTTEPKHVAEAKRQFDAAMAAALPHLVAALGAAGVVLAHRIRQLDELKDMPAERWHEDHNCGDC